MRYMWYLIIVVLLAIPVYGAELKIDVSFVTPMLDATAMAQKQVLLKFDIPRELQDARIDLAEVTIDIEVGTNKKEKVAVMVCPASQTWSESPAGLTDEIAHDDTIGVMFFVQGGESQQIDLNMTEYLQSWIDGETSNNGLLIKVIGDTEATLSTSTLMSGSEAEVKVFYTAPEKPYEVRE